MPDLTQIIEGLQEASQDELLAALDIYEKSLLSHKFREETGVEACEEMAKLRSETIKILKTKCGLTTTESMKAAYIEWNERSLREIYEASYCAECPHTPGFEEFLRLGGVLSCTNPYGSGVGMIYRLPDTKERCVWED